MLPMFGRRPLTRLEMGLYAAIFAVVATVLLNRLFAMMELAERSAMEQTVSRVNSSINLQLAHEMLKGQLINVSTALQDNPFKLAKATPPNYRGEGDAT